MSTPNQHYIEKADEFVSELAPGGLLQPEQALQFIELATLESRLLSKVRTETTQNPSIELSKLGFTGEVLRPGTEGEALGENERSVPVHDKVEITPKLYKAEVKVSYEAVEDNIIRGQFPTFLKQLAAKAIARDLEKLVIQGDTAGNGSALMKSQDGIIKQATSHTVPAAGARLSKTILTKMLRAMPEQYESEEANWLYLSNKNATIDYWDSFADRQTVGGDGARVGAPVGSQKAGSYGYHGGVEIMSIPLWPRNLGGTTDRTTCMLCDPKNIAVVYRRDIQMRGFEDIRRGMYVVVITMRVGTKFIHEDAVVQATDILASA